MEDRLHVNTDKFKDMQLKDIKFSNTIMIVSPSGKKLTLDFNGDELKTYGDLKFDEASKIFFNCLNNFFKKHFIPKLE